MIEKTTKVQFVDLRMSLVGVDAQDGIRLIKDNAITGTLDEMTTTWLGFGTGAPDAVQPTVAYASGTKIRLKAVFLLNTPAPVDISDLCFTVHALGIGDLNGVQEIKRGATEVEVDVISQLPLPPTAKTGQHSETPAEKYFTNDGIVKVGDRYLDPSYGVEYSDEADFEAKAIAGYATHIALEPATHLAARKPGPGSGVTFSIYD